jgi:epoxyqueuosine reductase
MQWLSKRFDERVDPATYMRGAQSVICVAMNYHVPLEPLPEQQRAHHGRIARYALGDDYHEIIKRRLHELADWIRQRAPHASTRAAVDTAPVMEKELAARAGVGWVGKNTCLINPRVGSWLLLGEIITTLRLPPDEPAVDRCGTCRRCLDACPTGALTAPYQLDARRCISYLTIEHRQDVPDEFAPDIGDWVYGCDICQDVCPWNKKAPAASDPALAPRFPTGTIDLRQLLQWRDEDYRAALKNSAMKRVKLPVLQRNARIVAENRKRQT